MAKSDDNLLLWIAIGVLFAIGGGAAVVAVYNQTRGLRNNNPGNIVNNAANDWEGQTGVDDVAPCPPGGFCVFSTADYGIRAIGKTLTSYLNQGINTVDAMISTWSTTDQAAYVQNVADAMNVDPDAYTVQETDLPTMVAAIIQQENGMQPFSMTQITNDLAMP